MPRETLDRQMHHLQDEVLLLGSMVEQATMKSMDALKNHDLKSARQLYDHDRVINEKRYAIENAIMIIMATQQPMAHDLRELAAFLEVTGELERMGDYAKGICKVTLFLADTPIPIPLHDLDRMAELGLAMLHDALGAFIAENASAANQIPRRDDEVDELYIRVYHSLISAMMANPEIIDNANHLMWVAHNLERLADRVSNICERTVFVATGELLELESPDDEEEGEEDSN
jgi:phosphate transport system protein